MVRIVVLLAVIFLAITSTDWLGIDLEDPTLPKAEISYSELLRLADEGEIEAVELPLYGGDLKGLKKDGSTFRVLVSNDRFGFLAEKFAAQEIEVTYFRFEPPPVKRGVPEALDIFLQLAPYLAFVLLASVVLWLFDLLDSRRQKKAASKSAADHYEKLEELNDKALDRLEAILERLSKNA